MKVIDDTSSVTLYPIIECKVVLDSIVYSDCWRSYNMSDVSEFKNFRINYSKLFADKKTHQREQQFLVASQVLYAQI